MLSFDAFGREYLEAGAERGGPIVSESLSRACAAHAARLPGRHFSLNVPRFKLTSGEQREFRIALPAGLWLALQGDADRQGVLLEQLVEHALISSLAHEQSGAGDRPAARHGSRSHGSRSGGRPARRRSHRSKAMVFAAAVLALPLLVVGLAAAGVRVPAPANSAFDAVGIELPNQSAGSPVPSVLPAEPADAARPDPAPPPGGASDSKPTRSDRAGGSSEGNREGSGPADGTASGSNGGGSAPGAQPTGATADPAVPQAAQAPAQVPDPDVGAGEPQNVQERIRDLLSAVPGLDDLVEP